MASRRKVDREGRVFNSNWKLQYFIKYHGESQAICVICNQVIAVLKEYNIRRHYTTRHSTYEQYSGRARQEKYDSLSSTLQQQQQHFTRYTEISEKATKCSLTIAQQIGRRQLPFQHGEFSKEVIKNFYYLSDKSCIIDPKRHRHW